MLTSFFTFIRMRGSPLPSTAMGETFYYTRKLNKIYHQMLNFELNIQSFLNLAPSGSQKYITKLLIFGCFVTQSCQHSGVTRCFFSFYFKSRATLKHLANVLKPHPHVWSNDWWINKSDSMNTLQATFLLYFYKYTYFKV